MLELVSGEEAARIYLYYLKLGRGANLSGTPAQATAIEPDLSALRGLDLLRQLAYHFSEFPYENISKIIKAAGAGAGAGAGANPDLIKAMRLPTEVVTDHVAENFGGTCFSLTFLFERMLTSLGFDCYKVMADMHSGRNVHCLVVVREGGRRYLVDPGYALYEVIALPDGGGERVRCPHAVVEVAATDVAADVFDLWTEDGSGRKWRYRFLDKPVPDADFEKHWLESFGKPTLNNICLTRMTPRGHIYLRKDFFKFTSAAAVEKRRISSGREALVQEEFGIRGEWVEVAQRLLDEKRERIKQGGSRRAGAVPGNKTDPCVTGWGAEEARAENRG
jgi:arylamine N-acetyltransferase